VTVPGTVGGHRYAQEVTYACLRRSGATMKLVERHGRPASNKLLALNGPKVAYTYSTLGVDTGRTEIIAANAATHEILQTVPNVAGFTDACIIYFRELTDLAITQHGAVAWIARTGRGCKTKTFQVYDASVLGEPILLDESPEIAPESLSLSKRGVSWEDAGRRRFAVLP
jgi:hypothetical protein